MPKKRSKKRFRVTVKPQKIRWWDRKTQTGGYRKNKRGAITKLRKDLKNRRQKIIETPKRKVYKETEKKITPIQRKITEATKTAYPTAEKPARTFKIKKIKGKAIQSYFKKKVYRKHLTNLREMSADEKGVYKKLLQKAMKDEGQLDLIIDQIEKNKHYLDYTITINGTVFGEQRELVRLKTQNKTIAELKKELQEHGIQEGSEIDSQTIDSLKMIGQSGGGRQFKISPTALRNNAKGTITEVNVDIEFIRGTI